MITRPSMLWVWAPLRPACLCPWAWALNWAHQGGVGCGKFYKLCADTVCAGPVAPLSEHGKAKWLWRFSWHRNNNRQQRFVSFGAIHILIIIIVAVEEHKNIYNADFFPQYDFIGQTVFFAAPVPSPAKLC